MAKSTEYKRTGNTFNKEIKYNNKKFFNYINVGMRYNNERKLGFCHIYWSFKKEILKTDYNIDWKSPQKLNQEIIFD